MAIGERAHWEYGQLVFTREPPKNPNDPWLVQCVFYQGKGTDGIPLKGDDPVKVLNDFGRDEWELVGSPETASIIGTYTDAAGSSRDRAVWVERRFWLKRPQ